MQGNAFSPLQSIESALLTGWGGAVVVVVLLAVLVMAKFNTIVQFLKNWRWLRDDDSSGGSNEDSPSNGDQATDSSAVVDTPHRGVEFHVDGDFTLNIEVSRETSETAAEGTKQALGDGIEDDVDLVNAIQHLGADEFLEALVAQTKGADNDENVRRAEDVETED